MHTHMLNCIPTPATKFLAWDITVQTTHWTRLSLLPIEQKNEGGV